MQCIYENHRTILTIATLFSFALATSIILVCRIFRVKPESKTDSAMASLTTVLLFVFCICYIILATSVLVEGFIKFIR